jgi:hypothetical protein
VLVGRLEGFEGIAELHLWLVDGFQFHPAAAF